MLTFFELAEQFRNMDLPSEFQPPNFVNKQKQRFRFMCLNLESKILDGGSELLTREHCSHLSPGTSGRLIPLGTSLHPISDSVWTHFWAMFPFAFWCYWSTHSLWYALTSDLGFGLNPPLGNASFAFWRYWPTHSPWYVLASELRLGFNPPLDNAPISLLELHTSALLLVRSCIWFRFRLLSNKTSRS